MIALSRRFSALVAVGRLVVEPIHPCHCLSHAWVISGVGSVGITNSGVGIRGEFAVRYHHSRFRYEIHPLPQAIVEILRHIPLLCGIGINVAHFGLFLKQEAYRRHAMIKPKGVHAYRIVVIHQARLARDYIKDEFIAPIAAKVVHHLSELLGTIFENVHRHTARFIHKRQCGEQSRQPEAVVAMNMWVNRDNFSRLRHISS